MAYCGGIWKTNKVLIELKLKEQTVILERTRGSKNKKKSVAIDLDRMLDLVEAVSVAWDNKPTTQLANTIPIGIIDGGCCCLRVEWGPYWFGRANALLIKSELNQCVAIEEQDVESFSLFLLGQWMAIITSKKTDLG